jgi:hypothetical protein
MGPDVLSVRYGRSRVEPNAPLDRQGKSPFASVGRRSLWDARPLWVRHALAPSEAEAPSGETCCPLRRSPRGPKSKRSPPKWTSARSSMRSEDLLSNRTCRSPVCDPKTTAKSSDPTRSPPRPKSHRECRGCSPATPEPKSRATERATRRSGARRPLHFGQPRLRRVMARRPRRVRRASHPSHRNRNNDASRRPARCRRDPKIPSETTRRPSPSESPKTSLEPGRRSLREGPKPSAIRAPPLAPREAKPRLDRTSGRDGPESFLAFRGLIPAAIRHSRASGLDRRVARSSHGLSTLQGFLPRCGGAAFTVPSPHRLRVTRARTTCDLAFQGERSEIGSSLSRPPTLLGFVTFRPSRALESATVRESPPQVPGCVTAP